jgi:hypothetical protein
MKNLRRKSTKKQKEKKRLQERLAEKENTIRKKGIITKINKSSGRN